MFTPAKPSLLVVGKGTDEIIAYGTTQLLRVRQIGEIYLMENLQTVNGEAVWRVVVRADGDNARAEIFQAITDANKSAAKMMVEIYHERKRREAASGDGLPGLAQGAEPADV